MNIKHIFNFTNGIFSVSVGHIFASFYPSCDATPPDPNVNLLLYLPGEGWALNRPVIQLQCNLSYLIYCQIIFDWMLNNNIMTMTWISYYLIFKNKYLSFSMLKIFSFLLLYYSVTHITKKPAGIILNNLHILKSFFYFNVLLNRLLWSFHPDITWGIFKNVDSQIPYNLPSSVYEHIWNY